MIRVTYQCKACRDEFDVEVRLGEDNDLPENCPGCNAPIPLDAATAEVEELARDKAEYHNECDADR